MRIFPAPFRGNLLQHSLKIRPRMPRINFCLISPHESELLHTGQNISCRNHRHISRHEVLKLTGGGKARPFLEDDKDLIKKAQINFNYHPIADWAMLPDGRESQRHLVLRHAREWLPIGGTMQLVPLGAKGRTTGNRYKTHCKQPRPPKC